jgi:hypothetical protein
MNIDLVISKYKNHLFLNLRQNHLTQYLKYKIGLLIHFSNNLTHNQGLKP